MNIMSHAEVTRIYVSVKNIRLHAVEHRELCRLKVRKDGDWYAALNYAALCKCPLINAHLYPRQGEIANGDKYTLY